MERINVGKHSPGMLLATLFNLAFKYNTIVSGKRKIIHSQRVWDKWDNNNSEISALEGCGCSETRIINDAFARPRIHLRD